MTARELIDLIHPDHIGTSCSDVNISNGFSFENDCETVTHSYGCIRCALLEIESGEIKMTEANRALISNISF